MRIKSLRTFEQSVHNVTGEVICHCRVKELKISRRIKTSSLLKNLWLLLERCEGATRFEKPNCNTVRVSPNRLKVGVRKLSRLFRSSLWAKRKKRRARGLWEIPSSKAEIETQLKGEWILQGRNNNRKCFLTFQLQGWYHSNHSLGSVPLTRL